jgi:hypothetical protein
VLAGEKAAILFKDSNIPSKEGCCFVLFQIRPYRENHKEAI